jgi:hypothetical protein
MFIKALVRNFVLMDMSEVILNSVARKKKGVITSAVQEMRIVKSIYSYYCEHRVMREGGWGAVCVSWCYSSLHTYRGRSRQWQWPL